MPVQTKSQANTLKIPKKMKKLKPGKLAYLKKMEEKAKKEFKYKHTELADPVMVKKEGKDIGKSVCDYTKGKLRNKMLRISRNKRINACGLGKNKIYVCGYSFNNKSGKKVVVKPHCRKLPKAKKGTKPKNTKQMKYSGAGAGAGAGMA